MTSFPLDRFVRLSTELLEALLSSRLTGVQLRIILWVIRNTAGWNRTLTPFSWYRIAKCIGRNRAVVWRAGQELLETHVLLLEDGRLGIHKNDQWRVPQLAPASDAPRQLWMPGGDVAWEQRQALPASNATVAAGQRVRCLEETVFRRAKDRCKDKLKTYIKTAAPKRCQPAAVPKRRFTANASTRLERRAPSPANMTAFLKIDTCRNCHRAIPWEWAPAILLNGKPMAGTGLWRSQLIDARCPACQAALESRREKEHRAVLHRKELVDLLGGEKPYRMFTFERYHITPGNQLAYQRCKGFNPALENLYLWGPCGVGKTHLAYATARKCFEETLSVIIQPAAQLTRRVRMKDPPQEQSAIDQFACVDALILDDLGMGIETAYARQVLQEILDRRDFSDRSGLVVTSKYSLGALAEKLADDSIPSRLSGMCSIVHIRGADARVTAPAPPYNSRQGHHEGAGQDHRPAL